MDVRSLPSHGAKQAEFSALSLERSQFDARTVRAKATDDPAAAQLNEGIGTADGLVNYFLIEDLARTVAALVLCPITGGRNHSLSFAGDSATMPLCDGDVALMTEAAQSRDATHEAIR